MGKINKTQKFRKKYELNKLKRKRHLDRTKCRT